MTKCYICPRCERTYARPLKNDTCYVCREHLHRGSRMGPAAEHARPHYPPAQLMEHESRVLREQARVQADLERMGQA